MGDSAKPPTLPLLLTGTRRPPSRSPRKHVAVHAGRAAFPGGPGREVVEVRPLVTWSTWLPSASITAMCAWPSTGKYLLKAMCLPSGDQDGHSPLTDPLVRGRLWEPSAFTTPYGVVGYRLQPGVVDDPGPIRRPGGVPAETAGPTCQALETRAVRVHEVICPCTSGVGSRDAMVPATVGLAVAPRLDSPRRRPRSAWQRASCWPSCSCRPAHESRAPITTTTASRDDGESCPVARLESLTTCSFPTSRRTLQGDPSREAQKPTCGPVSPVAPRRSKVAVSAAGGSEPPYVELPSRGLGIKPLIRLMGRFVQRLDRRRRRPFRDPSRCACAGRSGSEKGCV